MAHYFTYNWVLFVVTGLLLVGGKIAEDKGQFISTYLKMEMKSFYTVIGGLGLILSIVNFIALEFFGSWKMLLIISAIVVAAVYVVLFLIKRNK